jgi:hypothetical protein
MDDVTLTRQFRRWRLFVRLCFLAGVALLPGLSQVPGGIWHRVMTVIGLALIAVTFIFYFSRANRCPKCRRSFSGASRYKSPETDGLPLFGSIRACPFCGLDLR